ncbi:MAG: hypothetical protein R3A45_10345 [Bdellovibrionota bacterium]
MNIKVRDQSLIKPAMRVLLGRGSASVLTLIFLAYIARKLPKTDVALIALHATFVMLAKVISELGLRYCILREATPLVLEGKIQQAVKNIIGPCTWFRLSIALAISLLHLMIGLNCLHLLENTFPNLNIVLIWPYLSVHIFMKSAQAIITPLFFVVERFGTEAFLDSFTGLLEKIFALLAYHLLGISFFFIGFALGPIIALGIAIWSLRDILCYFSYQQYSISRGIQLTKQYWSHFIRQFFRQGMRQFDRILIITMLPTEQLANFHVARTGSSYLKYLIRAFADPLLLRFSESPNPVLRKKLSRSYYLTTISLPLLTALAGPGIMWLLGGAAYMDSWFVLVILCISYIFYALSELQLAIITILGKGDESALLDVLAGTAGVLATFILIYNFQEYGMPWGQLIAFALLWLGGIRTTRELMQSITTQEQAKPSNPV